MPNFPIRLGQGQGLERSGADQTQGGLLVLHNTDLSARDVVRQRAGYPPVDMTADTGFDPSGIRALWFRGGDLCAEVDAPIAAIPQTPRLWSYTPTLTTKWRDVGGWSRYTLRDIGAYGYPSGEVINVSASSHVVNGADVQWTVVQLENGDLADGAYLVRESDGIETIETLLAAIDTRPIIARVDAGRALVAYLSGTSVRYRELSPALGVEVNTTLVGAAKAWFATAASFSDGTPIYAFAVLTTGPNELQLWFASPGFTDFFFAQALALSGGTKRDVDLKIVDAEANTDSFVLYAATAAGNDSEAFRFLVDMTAGTVILQGQASTDHGGDEVMAVAVDARSFFDADVYVELSAGGIAIPRVELRQYTFGAGSSLIASRLRSALLSGTVGDSVVSGSGGSDAAWISMVSDFSRRGAVLWRGRTGEILARAGVGQGEGFTERATRKAHYPANRGADGRITVGARYTLQALDTVAKEAAAWTLTPAAINRPAVLDGVAVSAHGGYPRAYDGQQLFEQDWHELPEYTSATAVAAGFAAGSYGLAVTFEWTDRTGQLYRSAPTFNTIVLNGAQTAALTLQPLQWTERTGVRFVLWRTQANGTVYYRCTDHDAHTTTSASFTEVDAVVTLRETLDQVLDGVAPSEPARATDFIAVVGARLWTRDPRRGRLARFSQPRREGFAPHWPLTFGVELDQDREITAIDDLDGRVVLFGREQVAYTQGDGPDVNGGGSYPAPAALPVEIGATDHALIALSPFGLYFGSGEGVRLLSRGLAVADVSEAIDKLYEIDGQGITGLAYRADGAELLVTTAAGEQLIYHDKSARWATWGPADGEYAIVAAAQSGGVEAWADTAAVHIRNTTAFTDDGASSFAQAVGSPSLRPYSNAAAHSSFNLQQVTVFGTYEGSHGLQLDIYFDDETTPRFSLTVLEATVVANEAAGRPYIYRAELGGIACYTARVELRAVHSVPGRSFRLEGIDIAHAPTDQQGTQFPPEHLFAE